MKSDVEAIASTLLDRVSGRAAWRDVLEDEPAAQQRDEERQGELTQPGAGGCRRAHGDLLRGSQRRWPPTRPPGKVRRPRGGAGAVRGHCDGIVTG